MKLTRLLLVASVAATAYVCAVMCIVQPWLLVLIAIAAFAVAAKKSSSGLWAHGTARWCDTRELKAAGMLDADSGIILGRVDMPKRKLNALIALLNPRIASSVACDEFLAIFSEGKKKAQVRLTNSIHTMVVAPTGVGKGASFVIPHLLTSPDSTVAVDFKGENYRATADHRRTKFGHTIVALDPFKVVTQTPDSFNPLDFIDCESQLAIDECRDLSEALVVRTGLEKEAHWADSAELWIWAMIAVVVLYGETKDRSLQSVRKLLTNPDKMQAVIKMMCDSGAWRGILSRLGHQLTHFRDRELGSVLTTANRFLRFLDTLAIFGSTSSSFNPADLLKGKLTVYLILPPEHMRTQSPLLRMWIGSMLRAIVRGGIQEKQKVHFILDEAASLGRMEALDDAVDKYRAFSVRLQFYYQSLGQLKKCWLEGGDQTLLSNTSQIYFGVNDNETAKYVSERLGESTIAVRSGGSNTGRTHQTSDNGSTSTSYSTGTSDNWSQQGRHLLKPEEVMALSERIAIIFTPGVPPIWTGVTRHPARVAVDFGRVGLIGV